MRTCGVCKGEIHPDQGVSYCGEFISHRHFESCLAEISKRHGLDILWTERNDCS